MREREIRVGKIEAQPIFWEHFWEVVWEGRL